MANSLYLMLLGSVKVWDPRQKDKPVANMTPAEGEEGRDCWCVAFGETWNFSLSYLTVLCQQVSRLFGKESMNQREKGKKSLSVSLRILNDTPKKPRCDIKHVGFSCSIFETIFSFVVP